jgi:hypothetical protein
MTCLVLTVPIVRTRIVPLEQSEPDRQTSSSHPPSTRLPYNLLGRIDPGNRFPEFLEMRANISIEHQPQAGRPDSVQKARDGNRIRAEKLYHKMNAIEWGCYTAPLIG